MNYSKLRTSGQYGCLGSALGTMLLLVACLYFAPLGTAQENPVFGNFFEYTTCVPNCNIQGVALASVPAYSQTNELLAAVNQGNGLAVTYSLDGSTFDTALSYVGSQVSGLGTMQCNATAHGPGCGPSVVLFNNHPYISFQDSSNDLEIVKGTLFPENNAYQWSLVAKLNVGGMSTPPQMTVFENKIVIVYALASLDGYKNAMSQTYSSDGVNWTTTSSYLGALSYCASTQVGLSVLNSTLFMATEQNNSSRHLFYWSSPNGVNWSGSEDSALYTDSGISMVTFRDNLVFATKQNNSDDHLFIFSSPNGSTWYAQQYAPVIQAGTAPALALFNGGLSVAYVSSSNGGTFYASFATE